MVWAEWPFHLKFYRVDIKRAVIGSLLCWGIFSGFEDTLQINRVASITWWNAAPQWFLLDLYLSPLRSVWLHQRLAHFQVWLKCQDPQEHWWYYRSSEALRLGLMHEEVQQRPGVNHCNKAFRTQKIVSIRFQNRTGCLCCLSCNSRLEMQNQTN